MCLPFASLLSDPIPIPPLLCSESWEIIFPDRLGHWEDLVENCWAGEEKSGISPLALSWERLFSHETAFFMMPSFCMMAPTLALTILKPYMILGSDEAISLHNSSRPSMEVDSCCGLDIYSLLSGLFDYLFNQSPKFNFLYF